MRYFFSSASRAYNLLKEEGAENFLFSYAVDAKHTKKIDPNDNIIIDSGAFSVWNKGGTIDINDYLKFCKTKPEHWTFINLDVIPKTGSSQAEIDKCCEQGYENYLFLKSELPNVMPVYHYGDDPIWLKRFMEHTNYIGISPANDTHESVKRKFLKQVFHITQDKVKTHGLGYSSFEGLAMFPFYSIDSISFKRSKINGNQYWNEDSKLWLYLRLEIRKFLEMEKNITELWRQRGIDWQD